MNLREFAVYKTQHFEIEILTFYLRIYLWYFCSPQCCQWVFYLLLQFYNKSATVTLR